MDKTTKRKKKKADDGEMPEPDQVLRDLSDKSVIAGQSQEQWLDYLRDIRLEAEHLIRVVEKELDR